MVFVEVEADDVDGAFAPGNGDFHAVDKTDAEGFGFGTGFGQTAGVVVVGQGEQGAAVGVGEADDFGRGECAVGDGGVAVKVYHVCWDKVLSFRRPHMLFRLFW